MTGTDLYNMTGTDWYKRTHKSVPVIFEPFCISAPPTDVSNAGSTVTRNATPSARSYVKTLSRIYVMVCGNQSYIAYSC